MKHISVICTKHPDIDNIIKPKNDPNKIIDGKEVENCHHYFGGVYLHGIVETSQGYDCIELIEDECDAFAYRLQKYDVVIEILDIPTDIYECKVYGYDKPCTAFIWRWTHGNSISYRGLIVDNNDKEAYDYAKRKYDERSFIL